MPELPEVETVRRILDPILKGKTIDTVDVFHPVMIKTHEKETFQKVLKNQTIKGVDRLGKYLIFKLSDYALISHLRMEGKYNIKPSFDDKTKHEHVLFHFKDGMSLRYDDVRKFGTFDLKTYDELYNTPPLSLLGYEPFHPKFNAKYLKQKLTGKTQAIKPTLLDQTIVLGLGNIYVDEVLFCAKLHPKKQSGKVGLKRLENIVQCSQAVLEKAIKLGGSSIRSYTSSLGVTGRFQNELNVHTKAGAPCPTCKTTIIKIKVGGRGTYYCPTCQTKR